ncbi:MAG: hypothetical protein B6U89_01655 [Desulfurococcales archaeon ex4484_58]|nr:MAG: hypothetical protein B6U89_01655 [Desulfurococcales archaeon ex4484_58]
MSRYVDFLRHIVNVKIAKYISNKGALRGFDDIKRLLEEAEAKYGFSAFYGEPEKLKDYLLSDDFKLLVKAFKSIDALDLLVDILRETREKYRDLESVVEAIDHVLKDINREEESDE